MNINISFDLGQLVWMVARVRPLCSCCGQAIPESRPPRFGFSLEKEKPLPVAWKAFGPVAIKHVIAQIGASYNNVLYGVEPKPELTGSDAFFSPGISDTELFATAEAATEECAKRNLPPASKTVPA